MLLLYLGTVPGALVVQAPLKRFNYAFSRSLEDVVAFSLLRAAAVSTVYCCGAGAHRHRTYVWSAYTFAVVGGPFAVAKLLAFDFPRHSAPAVLLMLTSLVFTGLHISAAHNVVRWARRRADLSLDNFGYPLEAKEDAYFIVGRSEGTTSPRDGNYRSSKGQGAKGSQIDSKWPQENVSPHSLADEDSQFVDCGAFSVHLKEARPSNGAASCEDSGVMLIHGYGSGVFAWRHIMQPLSTHCGCRVLAFDRPAFGLTSRIQPPPGFDSPYSMRSAAKLAVLLAERLGLRRVVFVGHADGALVALLATAFVATKTVPGGQCSSTSVEPISSAAEKEPTEPASKTQPSESGFFESAPSGGWASLLMGPLAPLEEGGDTETASSSGSDAALLSADRNFGHLGTGASSGHLLREGGTQPGGNMPHHSSSPLRFQDQHRDAGEVNPETEAVAGPVSALAPSASATSLKLRGGGVGSGSSSSVSHSRTNSSGSSAYQAVALAASAISRHPLPLVASAAVQMSSEASDGAGSSPLAVVVIRGGRTHSSSDRHSDCATSSDDLADECGVYTAVMVPHRGAGSASRNHSCSASSAEEGEAAGVPFFSRGSDAAGLSSSGPLPLTPALSDDWQQLLIGQHYFASPATALESIGVALLHPDLSGSNGPAFSRMLAKSRLGRRMLGPLMRSEVGEISNRRAWHDPSLLTAEVLDQYKKPLRASNWDTALVEVSRLPKEISERQTVALCTAVARLPSVVLTGDHDSLSTPLRAAQVAADLCGGAPAVLRHCGHFSHEESPAALLKALSSFVKRCLADAASRSATATPTSDARSVSRSGLSLQGSSLPPLHSGRNADYQWSG